MKGKYLNRTFYDDTNTFWHSQGEYARWKQLEAMQEKGMIEGLRRQVRYPLDIHFTVNGENYVEPCTWISDFDYIENGILISEDFKSSYTEKMPEFARKRRLFQIMYGRDIRVFIAGKGVVKASTKSRIRKTTK